MTDYTDTLADVTDAAESKARLAREKLPAYLVHSAMAGAYVGLGIVLIFSFGTPLDAAGSPFTGVVMAGTFGVALSLVIVAGSDLFTGNTMLLTVSTLRGRTSWGDLGRVWLWSWVGNLAGSGLVAGLAFGGGVLTSDPSLWLSVAAGKMNAPGTELFLLAILCNWLVVLAVWSAFRLENETAKLLMVWWCLLAFIGSGYEHSVANMTVLTYANLVGGPDVSWAGMAHNLLYVTLGNVTSGALLMGGAYWYVDEANDDAVADANARSEVAPSSADD